MELQTKWENTIKENPTKEHTWQSIADVLVTGDPLLKNKVEKQWYKNHSMKDEPCPIELMKIILFLCNDNNDKYYDDNQYNSKDDTNNNNSKNNNASYKNDDDNKDQN